MTENVPENAASAAPTGDGALSALRRSRVAVGVSLAFALIIGLLSSVLAFYQTFFYVNDVGQRLYHEPGGARLLLGHHLRAAIGLWIAYRLARFLRSVGGAPRGVQPRGVQPGGVESVRLLEAIESQRRAWNAIAISLCALGVYSLGVTFVPVLPAEARFTESRFQEAFDDVEPPPVRVEFRVAEDAPGEGLTRATVESPPDAVWLQPEIVVSNEDIASVRVVQDLLGNPAVGFGFHQDAADRLRQASAANQGKRLAILMDGKVFSAATMKGLLGDSIQLTGNYTMEEAEQIVRRIRKAIGP